MRPTMGNVGSSIKVNNNLTKCRKCHSFFQFAIFLCLPRLIKFLIIYTNTEKTTDAAEE